MHNNWQLAQNRFSKHPLFSIVCQKCRSLRVSSGKIKKNVGNLTGVKHLTNSMPEKALCALVKLTYFHHYLFYFERIAGVLMVACSNHGKIGNILSFFADLRDLSSWAHPTRGNFNLPALKIVLFVIHLNDSVSHWDVGQRCGENGVKTSSSEERTSGGVMD